MPYFRSLHNPVKDFPTGMNLQNSSCTEGITAYFRLDDGGRGTAPDHVPDMMMAGHGAVIRDFSRLSSIWRFGWQPASRESKMGARSGRELFARCRPELGW